MLYLKFPKKLKYKKNKDKKNKTKKTPKYKNLLILDNKYIFFTFIFKYPYFNLTNHRIAHMIFL